MIGLPAHGFVLLSMPKCASTSLVRSLSGHAELVLRVNPRLKHMNCRSFHSLMVPVLRNGGYERDDYELVSLFREPVSWLESWWRYRQRPALAQEDAAKFTGEQSFEEFVGRYVDNDPRPGTLKGRPAKFVSLSDRLDIGVDRLFALEQPEVWQQWIGLKVGGGIDVHTDNRSSVRPPPELSTTMRARLDEFYRPEHEIYENLRATGEWAPPRGHVPGA
ncbi:MAG: hypothetical protein JWN91_865 [Nocardioides sp.]|jgi:hypothetical protein|nr:hypothetical protein [Nocardioides sp.]